MSHKTSSGSRLAWIAAAFVFAYAVNFSWASAQSMQGSAGPPANVGGPPAGVQKGPTPEQMAAFEREAGAQFDAFNQDKITAPEIPAPEFVSDDVKKMVPEKDLLELYCAMTRWKSGDFYSAMDALKKHLIPAVEQARTMGLDVSVPDVANMLAEGDKRVKGICAAKTVSDAEKQITDFIQWGKDTSMAGMNDQRSQMEVRMRAMGDGIRTKLKTQLQPFIDDETSKIEPDINAQANAIANSIVEPLLAAGETPDPASIQAQVESRLAPVIAAKQAEIEKKIRAKADELSAADKKQMEQIGNLFQGLDKKINDAIKSGESRYAAEKKKALTLRRDLILKLMDANLAEAYRQLDSNAGQFEQAKASDPSIKSAADLKAELAQDRKDLQTKLDNLLAADDEIGLNLALEDFADKWQTAQEQAAKAAAEPIAQVCSQAVSQFKSAKTQMQPAMNQIRELQSQCLQSTDVNCLEVQGLSNRLGTVYGKMNEIIRQMNLAESLCNSGEATPDQIMAVLQKIQSDGADAEVYGQALDADRSKAIAESVKTACDLALPQLQASRLELVNEDFVVLKGNLDACVGKTDARCQAVNGLRAEYESFKSTADGFLAEADQVAGLCRTAKAETDFEKVFSVLNDLNVLGDKLVAQANDLRTRQSKGSQALCTAVTDKLADMRTQVAEGRKEMFAIRDKACGRPGAECAASQQLAPAVKAVDAKSVEIMMTGVTVEDGCKNLLQSSQFGDLEALLARLQTQSDDLQKLLADLRKRADGIKQGTGIWIEAESDDSNYTVPVSKRPARNTKEAAPSWRPPYFGSGDWYLAAGGEWLGYRVVVPKSGVYNFWVRDYVDKFQPRGVRRIIIEMDGKRYAITPETTVPSPGDKGAFGWHRVGDGLTLTAGEHRLKVIKEATTSGAAILDAFYLTTGTETPPEK